MTGGSAAAVLEVVELSVRYGGVMALDAVSLSVAPAAVVGLIGPNGAGKTTFIDAVTGFTASTSGHVIFTGEVFDGLAPHDRANRGLVRTFQSLELFDDLTVRENLLVAAHTPSWWSTVTDALWPKRHPSPTTDQLLDLVGLTDLADEMPAELSNGQRHLVSIGRALANEPRLLLLDEPAAGLDTAETAELNDTVRRVRERGVSILLVDHDMNLVLDVCDEVYVLDYGRMIARGAPSDIRRDPLVIEAYLGQSTRT